MSTSQQHTKATAYWTVGPGRGELRSEELPAPGPEEALVRSLYSGISKGTELVVHQAAVPPCVAEQMRAPHQEGSFPSPVKFGYLSVGVVEQGPADWVGQTVFCLHPHQDRYVVPVSSLTRVPDGVPPRRAVLTGTVETAVNALWEAGPRLGDRVAVIGAGLVGGMVATLLRTFPLSRLQLVDLDPARRELANALGVDFAHPDDALPDCDIVFHCSASEGGLERSLKLVGDEGEIIEMSWYADRKITIPLGEDFHARRLSIRASQVGGRGAGPPAPPDQCRPAEARRFPAGGSGVRCLPHRCLRVHRTARRGPGSRRRPARGALPRDRVPRRRRSPH
jgi:NADPH:quinone reductase-like Zn-dependent oxidoreductase